MSAINNHFKYIETGTNTCYDLAREARKKGVDPVNDVETPIATTLAEKAIGLISVLYPQIQDKRIIDRILELEKEYGQLDPGVAFKIAEEIAKERYCKFTSQMEAIDAGIRVGFSYITLGVVSSPIEGFTGLKLGKTRDGKEYFKAYFSGPIRSAGTTASCMVLMLIDYLRETFGYAKYDPDENEVKRYVTENYDYHERVTNLQYLPTEAEIEFLARRLPIQIAGEPSEKREVSNYKDLDRVETNFIRGGMCLIFSEGLAQKAQKGIRLLKKGVKDRGFTSTGWDYLEEFIEKFKMKKKEGDKVEGKPVYIKDIVAGRPVFSHPSRSGGFRFRYGRSRSGGFSATLVHPATMAISNNFLSSGTQLKIEKPTKGCAITVCDEIDGPIVKLKNGSVRKLKDFDEAKKLYRQTEEIIYLGDILFPLDDVINRNYVLLKPGYVEEWWELELEKAGGRVSDKFKVDFDEAAKLSGKFNVPLHPEYIYYWTQIDKELFFSLIDWIGHGEFADSKMILPWNKSDKERFVKGKRALELIGAEHEVTLENVVLNSKDTKALLFNLGFDVSIVDKETFEAQFDKMLNKVKACDKEQVLEVINEICKVKIKDKAGSFIGARMGRPEKAKLRKLKGSPHVLFPVGEEGGRLRSFQAAHDAGSVKADFPFFYCKNCEREEVYGKCLVCGEQCIRRKEEGFDYGEKRIDLREYFDHAKKIAGVSADEIPIVKGVKGTSNADHVTEFLAKGLLRSKHNLHVNKDGTIRYDMTEMAFTHFKPKEIGTSVEKLKSMGYETDTLGKKLENDEQILELFPHDVVLPACPETLDEKADDVFLRISQFIDDELDKIYGLKHFYDAKKPEDLIGHLVVCIAPHICTASVGRIIGFSKIQALLASPYMHAAMRRDCLGYDNFVSIKENGLWRIKKIGEFIESSNPRELIDGFGTLGKKMGGLGVWSNPGEGKIKEITKHSPGKLLKLFLEDGREIKLTENHKVYTKGKLEKKALELSVGDKLTVSYNKNIEERDIDWLFLPEIFSGRKDVMLRNINSFLGKFEELDKHRNFYQRDSYPISFVEEFLRRHKLGLKNLPDEVKIAIKRDNVDLPIRILLEKELLEVIGLYIAEGYLRKNDSKKGFYQISIAGNGEIKEFVKKVFHSYFGLRESYENADQVVFSSRLVYELFKDYLDVGEGAKGKRIPYRFLDLKKEKLAALLRGYFEGDGSVSLGDVRVCCDSVSEGLKHDLSFALARFGILTKFYDYEKKPGKIVGDFYLKKGREIPTFRITKITILSNFVKKFKQIGFISDRKNKILEEICKRKPYGTRIDFDDNYAYPKIVRIEKMEEEPTYCFNVASEHNFFANDILVHNCDGDEAAAMLLMDLLLNFSKKFLPAHRGGTQDAPLVLNTHIRAGEVDDQILDFVLGKYDLEIYELAEQGKHSSEVRVDNVKSRLANGQDPFTHIQYTHETTDFNAGVINSSYKILPTMQEKVFEQMDLCKKIRAVDVADVARLVIERHFIRDTRGNLRKFSMQGFRCVSCNAKYRRPPLAGKCTKCGGKIIFTISEGSILKYMQPALDLAKTYGASPYLLENLELTEMYIHSIFGKEKEKQAGLSEFF